MKNFILSIFLFASTIVVFAQTASKPAASSELPFKYDSKYKTIYAKEMCSFLQKHPDAVLIDVRTSGEYADTSQFSGLNQGHLKGAINIGSETLKNDVNALKPYKNKTIVLYCSHSQRSRRVSKLLSENGFTNFYNLNGGMSSLNQLTEADFPCKNELIVSNLPYKNYSVDQVMNLIKTETALRIIDIRTVEEFNSKDTMEFKNIGRIKGAKNIPFPLFNKNWAVGSKEDPILVYGSTGDGNSARITEQLIKNGFTRVYQLLGGIDNFIASAGTASVIENATPFQLVNTPGALQLLQTNEKLIVYDTRPEEEYFNKLTGRDAFRNLGHIKNAIHITGFSDATSLPENKEEDILIYGNTEAFVFAKQLTDKGYTHVRLMPNFYDFVWSGFNVESCKDTKNFVVDHQDFY